jgi:hypothetical protein
LPPLVGASFKAPTSGGSTGRPKLIVATQSATWESLDLVTGPLYHNGLIERDHVDWMYAEAHSEAGVTELAIAPIGEHPSDDIARLGRAIK